MYRQIIKRLHNLLSKLYLHKLIAKDIQLILNHRVLLLLIERIYLLLRFILRYSKI